MSRLITHNSTDVKTNITEKATDTESTIDWPVTESCNMLVLTSRGQILQWTEALPDEGVAFLWENSDFHYLTKR